MNWIQGTLSEGEAEKPLLAARKILEKDMDQNGMPLLVVYETFATLYQKMGRDRDANEYAARIHKIKKPEQMQRGGRS